MTLTWTASFAVLFVTLLDGAVLEAGRQQLLPRWDLAGHLASGWTDFYYLSIGRVDLLAWDLWSQGLWPPAHSLFQLPFVALSGGSPTAGNVSSLAALLIVAGGGGMLCWSLLGARAAMPIALFLLLVSTSPYFLGYSTVAMTELFGSAVQILVVLAFFRAQRRRDVPGWRNLALALSLLFFTKYNYFLLLAVPLLLYVSLEAIDAHGMRPALHLARQVAERVRRDRWLSLSLVYACVVVAIVGAGGFTFTALGQRLAFRTIGYALHPCLYLALWRLWVLARRPSADADHPEAADERVSALLRWFAAPVLLWLAAPYPNHLKDFASHLVNEPSSQFVSAGAYLQMFEQEYFAAAWVLPLLLVAVAVAAARYRRQPAVVRLLVLMAAAQLVMIVVHPTRATRFLMTPLIPIWLVGALEVSRWLRERSEAAAAVVGVAATLFGAVLSPGAATSAVFRRAAFENYTRSPQLSASLRDIRQTVAGKGPVAVLGRSDVVSPGLLRLALGPASGIGHLPIEVYRNSDARHLSAAPFALLVSGGGTDPGDVARSHARLAPLLSVRTLALVTRYETGLAGETLELYRHLR